jgi:hypothetical protein
MLKYLGEMDGLQVLNVWMTKALYYWGIGR